MIRCQGTLPPTFGTRNGWPAETRVRCHRTLGVQTWQGSHGQMMVACPAHRKQVEALDAPYRTGRVCPVCETFIFNGEGNHISGCPGAYGGSRKMTVSPYRRTA